MSTITCYVYSSRRKPGTYVFLPQEDDWSQVPEAICKLLGETDQVMELALTREKQLARVSGAEVIDAIQQQGFYLQLPPGDPAERNPI